MKPLDEKLLNRIKDEVCEPFTWDYVNKSGKAIDLWPEVCRRYAEAYCDMPLVEMARNSKIDNLENEISQLKKQLGELQDVCKDLHSLGKYKVGVVQDTLYKTENKIFKRAERLLDSDLKSKLEVKEKPHSKEDSEEVGNWMP